MRDYDLLPSYRGRMYLPFESDHVFWKKLSKFFFVVLFHFLLILFLLTQSSISINQIADRSFNLQVLKPTFLLNNSSKEITSSQGEEHSSRTQTDRNRTTNDTVADNSVDASVTNHSQLLERSPVNVSIESAIHIPVPESKIELPVVAATSDASSTSVTLNPQPALSLDQEKEREVRIGESNTRVIEIHQMGTSKAVYSMPDLAQTGEARVAYQVDVGEYPDIELAIVNDVISKIRSRHRKEIFWNSHVKGRFVKLSMLQQDHASLEKFLRMEIFGAGKGKDYSFWDKSKF